MLLCKTLFCYTYTSTYSCVVLEIISYIKYIYSYIYVIYIYTPLRAKVQYLLIQCLWQLCRTQLPQIIRIKCVFIKRRAGNRTRRKFHESNVYTYEREDWISLNA